MSRAALTPSRRHRYSAAVAFGLIVALLSPAAPATAAPGPVAGPTELTVAYDALDSVTLAWGPAPVDAVGFALSYIDTAGDETTIALALADRSIRLTDIGYGSAPAGLRTRFADGSVSEPSLIDVLRGSVANLASAIDRIEQETETTLTETVTLSSRTRLAAAIGAARDLVAGGATSDQVLAAATAVTDAAADLVDYRVVLKYIADFEARDVSAFTPGSQARFAAALDAARQLVAVAATDPAAAVTWVQIETTVNELSYAFFSALAAPDELAALLAEAHTVVDGPLAEEVTGFSARGIRTAIAAADAAIADVDPTVDALDAAVESLRSALAATVARPSALRAAFAAFAELGLDGSEFSGARARDIAAAHTAAVAADDADTRIADLSAAGSTLSAAIAAAVRVDTLRDAIAEDDASLLIPLDYTSASWTVFARAFQTSVDLLAQATALDAAPITAARLSGQADSLHEARLALVKPTPFASSGITVGGPVRPAGGAPLPPGLYLQVIDGMISLSNVGGSLNFSAGQFGYIPRASQPPVIVPVNPNLPFTPPPTFTAPSTTITAPSAGSVDCEVRRVAFAAPDAVAIDEAAAGHPVDASSAIPVAATSPTDSVTRPPKTYCNRMAASGARMASLFAVTAAAAAAAPAYQIVSVLPATSHPSGNARVSFALPADADGGDLFLQYTYNGVYVETVAAVKVTQAIGTPVTGNSTTGTPVTGTPVTGVPAVGTPSTGTASAGAPTLTLTAVAAGAVAASSRPAGTSPPRLAATGTDSGPLAGAALLLVLLGLALWLAPSARRRRRSA